MCTYRTNSFITLGSVLIAALSIFAPPGFSKAPVAASTASPSSSSSPASQDDVVRLWSIIDYIRGDYQRAVVLEGEIADYQEFVEMQQFASAAQVVFTSLSPLLASAEQREAIATYLATLKTQIDQQKGCSAIQATADLLKAHLIEAFSIKTGPKQGLQLGEAQKAYHTSCASCHGNRGDGKGPLASTLNPPPRAFTDKALAALCSPFKYFTTAQFGIVGTAMPSFREQLSDAQLWSIAFLLTELPYHHEQAFSLSLEARQQEWQSLPDDLRHQLLSAGLTLDLLARSSDEELRKWIDHEVPGLSHALQAATVSPEALLRLLRVAAPYSGELPLAVEDRASTSSKAPASEGAEHKSQQTLQGIQLARAKVDEAQRRFNHGDTAGAEKELLDGYLFGFEKAEVALRLFNADLVKSIESLFIETRTLVRSSEPAQFTAASGRLRSELDAAIEAYSETFHRSHKLSGWASFLSSLVIILREGFEAFLLIAALLALLSNMGAGYAKRWVHAGWIAALFAGFASFVLFEGVLHLSGAAKETIEALCSGIAVIFLFYTGFWLLSQSERIQWGHFIKGKTVVALTSGSLWGLFSMSFIAVYREAAETILFYAALYSTASTPLLVSAGFVFGCFVLIAICWGIVRYNVRVPIKKFFLVTSCLMLALAIILAGKTVHELVEAGWIETTPLSWIPAVEILGLYPSVETLAAQVLLIGMGGILAGYFLRKRRLPSA